MPIIYHATSHEFHLYNQQISYLIQILENGQLGMLYYGKRISDKESFSYLVSGRQRSLAVYVREGSQLSLQYAAQEYPSYGTGDFHDPAFCIVQENGSMISDFQYVSHMVYPGKKPLVGLPATYTESEEEADTLEITLEDAVDGARLVLNYTIFSDLPAIARSARFINAGSQVLTLERAMSACVDLPDDNFEMVQLSGAWSRERHVKTRHLEQGIQSIGSTRGNSSAEHNPFLALKRPYTNEFQGEVYAISLVYSSNFLAQVEVDTHGMSRALIGIHPDTFSWQLNPGESFQTPEAVLAFSANGLNSMSQTYHRLYGRRLARGFWRDRERPVLINNWEATEYDFDEKKILRIAKTAKQVGIELFVLDDGWFGARRNDFAGLGDWVVNREKLPDGIAGLANKIEALGMKFGFWIEPEMVNIDSDLYRSHPDWILHVPARNASPCRHQYVLDFSRSEVVDAVHDMLYHLLSTAKISYIKWDMNRYLSECYSIEKPPSEQGKVFHQYILGVYNLYERLLKEFPNLLFESCSSGGARFDPGMLYYAPQGWISDNTDAIERLRIQYGTSFVYPLSSMGAHVSMVPNQQVGRITPLETRTNVAMFGAFGYELDLNSLSRDELDMVAKQITFIKEHRQLLQFGIFWRLRSPFEGNDTAWITVSPDQSRAVVAYFQILNRSNTGWDRLKLAGLDPARHYYVNGNTSCVYGGDELMEIGLVLQREEICSSGDFSSTLFDICQAGENEIGL
jgi:alpha-galactosidase